MFTKMENSVIIKLLYVNFWMHKVKDKHNSKGTVDKLREDFKIEYKFFRK